MITKITEQDNGYWRFEQINDNGELVIDAEISDEVMDNLGNVIIDLAKQELFKKFGL